ncbi:hypothetical protein ACFWXH_13810 [Mesorhizobium sp. NPDC059054]|uniref:hypothetical protein n=1 Tax=Mesorhizobium sp. NPDC059054 TaxID=3346711 RepID=UPI0036A57453
MRLLGGIAFIGASVLGALDAHAVDISGIWKGAIRCSWGSGSLNITVGRDGSISGGVTNGTVTSGSARGRSVRFSTTNAFGNVSNFTGTIVGDDMSGTYSQGTTSEICNWDASLRTGIRTSQSPNPGKDPEPDYSRLDAKKKRAAREKDARSFLTAGAAAARYCTYADQMTAAGRFSQAAEAFRLMGDSIRETKADRLAKAASARADVCQRKQRAARAAPVKKADQVAKAGSKDTTKECKALADYQKKLAKAGELEASLKVRLQAKLKFKCR